MHELSITMSVVEICAAQAAARGPDARVVRVTLEVGELAGVVADSVRFCFDACSRNTVVEGADLEIIEIPGRARCRDCGSEMASQQLFGQCRCGSVKLDCIAGRELKIKQLEVTECAQPAVALTQTA